MPTPILALGAWELQKLTEFPEFMRNGSNAIDTQFQSNGVQGYVYDGADGTQMAVWTCPIDGYSDEHVHSYDEYMVVVQGQYDVIFRDKTIEVKTGDELYIPKNTPHAGRYLAGTRTIHAFGGERAKRNNLCSIFKS